MKHACEMTASACLMLTALLTLTTASAFAPKLAIASCYRHSSQLFMAEEQNSEEFDEIMKNPHFTGAETLEFVLPDHVPLGCTIEESLAPDAKVTHVFVSKILKDGSADKAGIKIGDVVIGVSGMFEGVTVVSGDGIEKIKNMVSGVPKEDPLTLRVARGTTVVEEHEAALLEICADSSNSIDDVDACVVDYLKSGMAYDEEAGGEMGDDLDCDDPDTECLIDDMYTLWATEDDLPLPKNGISGIAESAAQTQAKKVKPWSSRSSPSGTWVRDPVTREMKNIDAQ